MNPNELLRTAAEGINPVLFAERLGLTPDPWQADLLVSPHSRIILNCSRQSGKTSITAVLALHHALYHPGALVLILSPSLRQSSELFKRVASFYRSIDKPIPSEIESALKLELENGSRIISLPGKEQTVRGYSGVSLLIIDEASRVADELYYSVRPMLAVSGGKIILLSTPFGKRGFFYETWANGEGEGWHMVKITAKQCPRISQDFLEEEKRALGEWWFQQEYCCEFRDTIDSYFSHDEIRDAITTQVTPLYL